MKSLHNINCFIFDLDGTLYLGGKLIDGAAELLQALKFKGKKYCFLTNNSSLSTSDYIEKLKKMGLPADTDNVLTSGFVAKNHIKQHFSGKRVYVLGTDSYRQELAGDGINVVRENPDIVLISYDRELDYQKLCEACLHIAGGARYFATHNDINCPSESGGLPDAGSFMALIKASTGRECEVVFGKPFSYTAGLIAARFNLPAKEIAMVGDRLSTDIKFGTNNGYASVLVLTGDTDINSLEKSGQKPDYVFNSVKDMIELI